MTDNPMMCSIFKDKDYHVLVFEELYGESGPTEPSVIYKNRVDTANNLVIANSRLKLAAKTHIGAVIHPGWLSLIKWKIITAEGIYFVPFDSESGRIGYVCVIREIKGKLSIVDTGSELLLQQNHEYNWSMVITLDQERISTSSMKGMIIEVDAGDNITDLLQEDRNTESDSQDTDDLNFDLEKTLIQEQVPTLDNLSEDKRSNETSSNNTGESLHSKESVLSEEKQDPKKSGISFLSKAIILSLLLSLSAAFIYAPKGMIGDLWALIPESTPDLTSSDYEFALEQYKEAKAQYVTAWPSDTVVIMEVIKILEKGTSPSTYGKIVKWDEEISFALKLDYKKSLQVRNKRVGINGDYIISVQNFGADEGKAND